MSITKSTNADHSSGIWDKIDRIVDEINSGGAMVPSGFATLGLKTYYIASSSIPGSAAYNYACDGINDQVQIIACINAANTDNGGNVVLSPGVFNISSNIFFQLSSKVKLTGSGIGITTIRVAADYSIGLSTPGGAAAGAICFVSSSNCELSNLTLDCYTNAANCNPIMIRDNDDLGTFGNQTTNTEIHHIEILGTPGHHYQIFNLRARRTVIHHCIIDGKTVSYDHNNDDFATIADQNAIEFLGGSGEAYSNKIYNMGNAAFIIGPLQQVANSSTFDVNIHDNYVQDCGGMLTYSTAYDATAGTQNLTDLTFSNNIGSNLRHFGIYATHTTGAAGASAPRARNISIVDNMGVFDNVGGSLTNQFSIWLRGVSGHQDYTSLENYVVSRNNFYGAAPIGKGTAVFEPHGIKIQELNGWTAEDNNCKTIASLLRSSTYTFTASATNGVMTVTGLAAGNKLCAGIVFTGSTGGTILSVGTSSGGNGTDYTLTSNLTFASQTCTVDPTNVIGAFINICDNFKYNRNTVDGANKVGTIIRTIKGGQLWDNRVYNWNLLGTGSQGWYHDTGTSSKCSIKRTRLDTSVTTAMFAAYQFAGTCTEFETEDNTAFQQMATHLFSHGFTGTTDNNYGIWTPAAGATSTLTNKKITTASIIYLQSEVGVIVPTKIVPAKGSAVVTWSSSVNGTDTYRFIILNP